MTPAACQISDTLYLMPAYRQHVDSQPIRHARRESSNSSLSEVGAGHHSRRHGTIILTTLEASPLRLRHGDAHGHEFRASAFSRQKTTSTTIAFNGGRRLFIVSFRVSNKRTAGYAATR